LYAARIQKPPEVKKTTVIKDNKTKKIEKPSKTQKNLNKSNTKKLLDDEPIEDDHIMEDQPLLTQPYAPVLSAKQIDESQNLTKRIRSNVPVTSKISYSIENDILNRKADIDVKDLIIAVPALKRDLVKAIRESTRKSDQNTLPLTFAEDDDVDTTAIYTDFYVNGIKIRAMLDTGSAKTCIAKNIADKLGLDIDAASTSVFTLGNGSKQASLGLIYDVPLNLGGGISIPGSIEVLPVCPVNLIIGNNWMKRAKARLNLEDKKISVEYKNVKFKNDFTYTRETAKLSIQDNEYTYHKNSNQNKVPPKDLVEDSDSDDSLYHSDDESDDELMMLVDEFKEINQPTEFGRIIMRQPPLAEDDYYELYSMGKFYIPPHSKRQYTLETKQFLDISRITTEKDFKFICNITNEKLYDLDSQWQPSSSFISENNAEVNLCLINSTDEAIIFEGDEVIAEIEILYLNEVKDIQEYKIAKPKYDYHDLKCNVMKDASDEHLNMLDEDCNQFETFVKDKVDISNVPEELKSPFLKLLYEFEHIFDWENNKIGNIDVFEHEIKLKPDAVPKRVRPYRLSPIETESLRKELDKLMDLGVIEKGGYSDWASPIIMIKKKDNTYRIVADFRYLNSQSQVMNYPISNIDELLDKLNKAHWMSQFDLRSGFFQANLSELSQPLTTVVCPLGAFYFKKLPQGIQTSPHVFSEIMERCFHELLHQCVVLYLDDVTTFTVNKNPEDHLTDLEKTFKCMSAHGIVLNPKKSHFFKEEILFLGYIVARDSIKPNPETVKKIKDYPLPVSIKDIRSFIGLASYYRRFVPNFAKIARPLHEQLKSTKRISWNDEATSAFYKLKTLLTSEPILTKPDFTKEFFVVTDASIDGIGAILTQKDDEDREHPIVYSSRALQGSEKNYGVSKLELLAVVWALQLYRPYLLGSHFQVTVISDHSALNGLLKSKKPTGIIARWIEILSEYDFKIIYRPGRVNESADFLSRLGY
jgi:hypothetical protein